MVGDRPDPYEESIPDHWKQQIVETGGWYWDQQGKELFLESLNTIAAEDTFAGTEHGETLRNVAKAVVPGVVPHAIADREQEAFMAAAEEYDEHVLYNVRFALHTGAIAANTQTEPRSNNREERHDMDQTDIMEDPTNRFLYSGDNPIPNTDIVEGVANPDTVDDMYEHTRDELERSGYDDPEDILDTYAAIGSRYEIG